METLYFTLGIASVVVAAVAVGAVWAMFKVAKLNSMLRDIEQQFGSTHRDITMVEQTIMNNIEHRSRDLDNQFSDAYRRMDEMSLDLDCRIEQLYHDLDHKFDESVRYTDSRIDKLVAKQEKQLIKG
jgi:cell division protein ZapA (FtsZ GTPase activity inhibitor)